jgi:Carboxypeptidase regulatory-like domain/TonB dependent receptor
VHSPSLGVFVHLSKRLRAFLVTVAALAFLTQFASAQQTLGAINGTVTDSTGAVVAGAAVKARSLATNLEVTAETKSDGSFSIADLPIGTYEVKFIKDGFETAAYPQIIVQGNRTATVNAKLKPGAVSSTVTVEATPLLNSTDTTTGYSLDEQQITDTPLGTGSFTQLAILSPGVSADLLNTAGTNAGLGNQAIWANGQRDTSNSFTVNGVDANNIFNGKSTSQVSSSRVAVNIGENGNGNNPSGEIVTSTSVYGAIGQAMPTPPPETIQEMHVNSAMYDASQGSNSGAQIGTTTKSGTNAFHGGAYEYHQQTGWNANQWFFNNVPPPLGPLARPQMHRNVFGAYLGGPIKKDKLFFFASYQGQRVSDQLLANSIAAVPPGLTDSNRTAQGLADLANADFSVPGCGTGTNPPCLDIQAAQVTQQAVSIMSTKAPGGSWWIPNAASAGDLDNLQGQGGDAEILGPNSRFTANQVNANVDYNFSSKDRLAAKYYYQNDPNTTPFAQSTLLGFPQTMQAGSQTVSLDNITALTPNMTWEQRFGFIREKAFATTTGFLSPSTIGVTIPGSSLFPGINIKNADNYPNSLAIGPVNNFSDAGVFQNNYEFASNLKWVHGRQSIAVGFNLDNLQLNVVNKNNEVGRITFEDFPGFLMGNVCGPSTTSCGGQDPSQILSGATNRYYRAKQLGTYVQDNIKIKSNLTLNVGLRWDWDGPLWEKNGNLTNFYPKDYSYNVSTDTISNIGLVVAGNNKTFGTKGVSNSTLTGRQWGFAPRIGLAYNPAVFNSKVVVRAGFGMYFDRGEYFTEFSPPAGGGISGPFGVTVEEPFVVPFYAIANDFGQPFGTATPPPPPGNLSQVQALLPNAAQLIANNNSYCASLGETGCGPLFFGGYDPKNVLPYSENWTLDLQWQPKNNLVMSLGYVGNHGVHEIVPLPFNQAGIATQQNPLLAGGPYQQNYSYGYNVNCGVIYYEACTPTNLATVPASQALAAESVNTLVAGYGTGNVALRAPYIGYDPNSVFNRSVGISNYNAIQFNVTKRMSHGFQISGSYTFSHTLDEQSGLGLFFTGNDPNDPHSSYATSDFDRTHVLTVSYHYEFPKVASAKGFVGQVVNGWAINGVTVLQSGQAFSVFDYSGGAASIYWGGGQDLATNPIVPVAGYGSTQTNAVLQGTTGVNGNKPVLNANAFGIPTPFTPGASGVPPCDPVSGVCDPYENGYASGGRNIFRAPFQNRFDFGLTKNIQITERFLLKYDLIAFNVFNHPSFDIPSNNVEFNPYFANPPYDPDTGNNTYTFPPHGNLGVLQHSIGSPRFIQMALHLTF